MKHSFSEYDPPKNTGLSWDPIDSTPPLPEMSEFKSELNSFYNEIFQPVWQFMRHTVSTILAEWFSGGLNALGQLVSWVDSQAQHNAAQVKAKRLQPTVRQVQSLTLESTLAVRKVNNDLGNRGKTILNKTDEQYNQPMVVTNPWLEAVKKQRCTLPVQSTIAYQTKPNRPQLRNKKMMMEEPNRGLDDIYTSPVSPLFVEDPGLSTLKKPASKWRKPVAPAINTQVIAAMIDAELERKPQQAKWSSPHSTAKPTTPKPRQAATFPGGKTTPPIQPANQMASQFDAIGSFNETFEQLQASLYCGTPARSVVQSAQRYAEPEESEFIPGLTLEATLESLSEPEQVVTPEPVELPLAHPPQASERAGAYPPSNLLHTKGKAAHMDFKKQMPVYQEMKHEMSGADHMVRNNRILHNSISNLADSYFKKAALEEAENS